MEPQITRNTQMDPDQGWVNLLSSRVLQALGTASVQELSKSSWSCKAPLPFA
jgi:hypothetical protein